MKTHQQQRRAKATRREDARDQSTIRSQDVPRGVEKTCKVAVPENLHAATKLVAARRKRRLQDFVAELLRTDADVAREEATFAGGAA
jgi:hypothetical protein